ncbi:TlpA disulfide reductase family protein [uncultured Bacteroides sp.]|uniref:TlpA family protein disulfide reductase n=1 Tax=uncultured Bacteroides sp. TaxID=162156 RepID=UPI002AAA7C9A|nr:TlpA disulfide reductase family protein [uncultured Bacteroides sp.]
MKHLNLRKLLFITGGLICLSTVHAQLLKGTISAKGLESLQVAYAPDGDMTGCSYIGLKPDEMGTFSFDVDLPVQHCDVGLYVNNEIFGVHLEKGKTAIVHLQRNGDKYTAEFDGDNAKLSRYYSAYLQAFDIMKYFSADEKDSHPSQYYYDLLDREYATLKNQLSKLDDKQWHAYYAKLSEGMYTWSKLRILLDQSYEEEKKVTEYPYYNKAIAAIDPNDEMNIRNNLIFLWLGAIKESSEGKDAPYRSMDMVEKRVTNPAVRYCLTRYIAYSFFTFEAGTSDVEKFWARYQFFAKDYPQLIEQYSEKASSLEKIAQNSAIPYDPVMSRPDGTTCKLSDLFGSFIYIDVWATWCVPCRKEIPHLEKLVEHFAGNNKIQIISISIDEKRDPWLKMLNRDKPKWPQFILSPEEEQKFMDAWGIAGIPRFIMIDKEGRIFSADAIRPSNGEIISTLEKQL